MSEVEGIKVGLRAGGARVTALHLRVAAARLERLTRQRTLQQDFYFRFRLALSGLGSVRIRTERRAEGLDVYSWWGTVPRYASHVFVPWYAEGGEVDMMAEACRRQWMEMIG